MKYTRIFDNLKDAETFATQHNSRAVLRYEWDDVYGLIELYEVQFV